MKKQAITKTQPIEIIDFYVFDPQHNIDELLNVTNGQLIMNYNNIDAYIKINTSTNQEPIIVHSGEIIVIDKNQKIEVYTPKDFNANFTQKPTLNNIWLKRYQQLQKLQTQMHEANPKNGKPHSGFDFSCFDTNQPISEYTTYSTKNWNDGSISDLRDILTDIVNDTFPSQLDPHKFQLTHLPGDIHLTTLTSTKPPKFEDQKKYTPITIIASAENEQPQFTIYVDDSTPITISWYKRRGRIDSIITTEYGHPATIGEITDVLVALHLEQPYELEDNNQ